ncbi:MAG: site-specific DNA-methyltransferase [Phycisphaerales bacterium]
MKPWRKSLAPATLTIQASARARTSTMGKKTTPKQTTPRASSSAASRQKTSAQEPRKPDFHEGTSRVWVGDCREILASLPEVRNHEVDLVFADPPFNWNRAYDQWDDRLPREEYLAFTRTWLDLCVTALRPGGAMWVNIPDDTAAEIVVHLKSVGMEMENWCVWHYRFGQNTTARFINSKVHALYFCKPEGESKNQKRTFNAEQVLEASDRASTYFDPRTLSKADGMPPGQRVPMDVWYGPYWGRIQGNNKERRGYHDNQLPEVYLERVILATSNKGDLVLDPFLGSGTTGVVAHALKRRFIGTEFSRENATLAFNRITKVGPIRLGVMHGASTAIHAPRRPVPKTFPATMSEVD